MDRTAGCLLSASAAVIVWVRRGRWRVGWPTRLTVVSIDVPQAIEFDGERSLSLVEY
jgi:hypothetical protein